MNASVGRLILGVGILFAARAQANGTGSFQESRTLVTQKVRVWEHPTNGSTTTIEPPRVITASRTDKDGPLGLHYVGNKMSLGGMGSVTMRSVVVRDGMESSRTVVRAYDGSGNISARTVTRESHPTLLVGRYSRHSIVSSLLDYDAYEGKENTTQTEVIHRTR